MCHGTAWNQSSSSSSGDLDKAQGWARQYNRPLYPGEFGAYDKGDMASRVTSRKLVIAVYVMTYDVAKPMQEQQYQLAIRGLPAVTSPQTLYDPITGDGLALQATREGDTVEVPVPVLDYPRLMVVE